ncbi:hypothetical protein O1L52_11715 [Pseudomonas aeruginosa]|uniref:hypothetical protein n=1 Tax=Pseudomonas aeruginosa TaxID=287 RepID=UPI000F54C5A2|nr:hypothetical protein [Pseudomonas aeruginosa]MCO2082436.1 hypothetical protein [Pseudomonas aeruginosa]
MSKELNKAPVEQAGTNVGHGHVFPRADGVKMRCGGPRLCSECAADAYPARAALALASSAQTEHERDMLGQALGECIEAAGIIAPGAPLTGPQLLMFAEDLKRDLQRAALAKLAELETALTPFAAVADAYDDSEDDDHEPYTDMGCDDRLRLTLSQHRAARTALSGAPSQAQHSVPEASEQEKEQGWTLDYRFVERVTDLAASRTEYTTSMEATEQVLLAARELLAAAPGKEGA